MRRLWAYIIIAFTSIVAMGTTFPTIFKGMRSNIEYQDGRELVFRISDKEDKNSNYRKTVQLLTTLRLSWKKD